MTTTEHLRGFGSEERVPAFSARHSVADARGADAPAHPPLTLIAELGGQQPVTAARVAAGMGEPTADRPGVPAR
jgi:hypothetical protein